jgi:hypothetical protein
MQDVSIPSVWELLRSLIATRFNQPNSHIFEIDSKGIVLYPLTGHQGGWQDMGEEAQRNYVVARRLFAPLLLGTPVEIADVRKNLSTLERFTSAYPEAAQQESVIDRLKAIVVTPELLLDHARLQEVLFPLIALRLDAPHNERASSLDWNLYTYPEHFAWTCATAESRRDFIVLTKTRVEKELKEDRYDEQRWLRFVKRMSKDTRDGNALDDEKQR